MKQKVNLISIGIASYNFKEHVSSDILTEGYYIPAENLRTQQYLDKIFEWTEANQMILNNKKSKIMIFNFTRDFPVSARAALENEILEIIHETKLLGVLLDDELSWDRNTMSLVRRANSRMRLLHKLVEFDVPIPDLIQIYTLFIRSIVEQSCVVWHSSLTVENSQDLERIQKNALKIILKDQYTSYSDALKHVGLDMLSERREKLCLTFARNCVKNESTKDMFPLNENFTNMSTRNPELFQVQSCRTERLKNLLFLTCNIC